MVFYLLVAWNHFIQWFNNLSNLLGNRNPDPVKHCHIYKTVGCAHVDGYLCDLMTCTITHQIKVSPMRTEVIPIIPVEQVTNRAAHSQDFTDGNWTKPTNLLHKEEE